MIILYFDGRQQIEVGQHTVVFSEAQINVGQPVEFRSQMGEFLGTSAIAYGTVISKCKDERGAPVTPTKSHQPKKNAWRWLYRVKVDQIT